MWHIPLKEKEENETTNILVVDQSDILHAILNVYELPSTYTVIRYLHAAAGFTSNQT